MNFSTNRKKREDIKKNVSISLKPSEIEVMKHRASVYKLSINNYISMLILNDFKQSIEE